MLDIAYSESALKQMMRLPKQDRLALDAKIHQYAAEPSKTFGFVKRLTGRPETRIRHGVWRALVLLEHDAGLLYVIDVAHRREVYG